MELICCASAGWVPAPFQAANGLHPQQQQQQPAGWKPQHSAPHSVSDLSLPRLRNGPHTAEQRLTSHMSQMQMPSHRAPLIEASNPQPGHQIKSGPARRLNHPSEPMRQRLDSGQDQGAGRSNQARPGSTPASVTSLRDAPPLTGSTSSSGKMGGPAPARGPGAGPKQGIRAGPKGGPAKPQGASSQRKRKSDDESPSGDPPASRRKVAAGSHIQAVAETGPATPSSGNDWKAAAESLLQRNRPAR